MELLKDINLHDRVIDIFYNSIIEEAVNGRINCYFMYNIIFDTIIEDKNIYKSNNNYDDVVIPTLNIKNKDEFNKLLVKYVQLCLNYYDDSFFENEILDYKCYENVNKICKEKVIMSLLFANATIDDFENVNEFLKRKISFLENIELESINLGYSNILNSDLCIEIKKDIINNETPSKFVLEASNAIENYTFPEIKFGICNNTAYVYAIQNTYKKSNNQSKKINRALYKVKDNFNSDNDNYNIYGLGNLNDITPSFLVVLNVFISYLYSKGINKVVASSILLERWNAKKITNIIKYNSNKIDERTFNELNNVQELIQKNLTEKFIRNFLRLKYHYDDIELTAYPFDIDSNLHLTINSLDRCNNELLFETSHMLNSIIKK